MANLNDLPPGLWLHFSEESEVECEHCDGHGMSAEHGGYSGEYECPVCHHACVLKVRVTGAVEVKVDYDYDRRGRNLFYFPFSPALAPMFLNEAREYAITAYLADELPDEITKYIKREEL